MTNEPGSLVEEDLKGRWDLDGKFRRAELRPPRRFFPPNPQDYEYDDISHP